MNRDKIFESGAGRGSDFEFNAEVAEVFDDMLERSVPFYKEQQFCIGEIAGKFWIPGTKVYDLGCSTAETLLRLRKRLGDSAQMVGYDYAQPMLDRARLKLKKVGMINNVELKQVDFNANLDDVELENASIVTLCWTLQFVRPLFRDRLIKWIYDGLVNRGALIVTEKILTNDSNMNRFFIEFYYDFKRRNGYSEQEILRKREALENVLVPYRVDENFKLFRHNGFEIVETFFQWYNFVGFLCVKNLS